MTSEDEKQDSKPLSKWKVSIKSSKNSSQSTLCPGSAGGGRTFVLKSEPETLPEPEDLRLLLSRKRPRILTDGSSSDGENHSKRSKTLKSVVVVPK